MIPNSNFEWVTSVLRSANCEGSGQKCFRAYVHYPIGSDKPTYER